MIKKIVADKPDLERSTYIAENGNFIFQSLVCKSPPNMIRHLHDGYEILFLFNGEVRYFVEGNMYDLNPFDIVFTNMRETHFPVFKDGTPYSRYNIVIKPSFLSAFISDEFSPLRALDSRKSGVGNKIDAKLVREHGLDTLFFDIKRFLDENSPESTVMVKLYLTLLLVRLSKISNLDAPAPVFNSKVAEIIKYVNENLEKDLSYKGISKALFINKNYLYHFFKKETGFALYGYVKAKRIIKAKDLLLEGVPISQVPEMVGFNDYSNFYRTFKNMAGASPKDFIKEYK